MKVLHLSNHPRYSIGRVVIPSIVREMAAWGVESEAAFSDGFSSPLDFWRLLLRFRPDVIHYQFMGMDHSFMGTWCVLSGIPFVISIQGLNEDIAGNRIKRGHLRWLLGRADAVTAVSDHTRSEVKKIAGGVDVARIFNGVSAAASSGSSEPMRRPPRPYVISVAKLHPTKGLDMAAMAFRDLIEKGHDIDWVICGEDLQSGHLQRLTELLGIGDRVHILGHLPYGELSGWISKSLFLVHTARYEPFGMAVVEAMALGKPVLVTSVGGVPEYVRHGENGLLVRWGDVEGLRDSMLELLSDEDLRERLGREAQRTAARFSWTAAARGYFRIYQIAASQRLKTRSNDIQVHGDENETTETEATQKENLLASRN